MTSIRIWACLIVLLLASWRAGWTQESAAGSVVPMLVNFSGTLSDAAGKPLTATTSVTFSLYQNQQGGSPLWAETQSVQPNGSGLYSVTLGSATGGLPAGLFVTGEPRWLEVQAAGQAIQPRVILLSVPYALKAGDAQTIGGLPPSAFVLAAPTSGSTTSGNQVTNFASTAAPPTASDVTTTGGTVNVLPLWTTATNIQNSAIAQTGTGSTAKIGIGTTAPAAALDIKGGSIVRGTLNLPAMGVATATAGKNSQPQTLVASAFNSSTAAAVAQTFQWQAEPVGNNTTSPAGSLNLLYATGTSKPAETGLHIASNGQITFAVGQTFPGTGTGDGTVTSVASGSGLTGGPITSTGTLSIATGGVSNAMLANSSLTVAAGTAMTGGGAVSLGGSIALNVDTTKVPLLAASNTFTGNQSVIGSVVTTGAVNAGTAFDISGTQVVSILPGLYNLYLGQASGQGAGTNNTGQSNAAAGFQALYLNTSGSQNSALGAHALYSNTTGSQNTANGTWALQSNTTGIGNTGFGINALFENSTGATNTATGDGALYGNTTGSNNTANGFLAGGSLDGTSITGSSNTFLGTDTNASTGTLNNATAIGANAEVTSNNTLVLGSINGVNGATASVNVGIGTTAPATTLDVHGTGNFTGNVTFASTQTFPGTGTITGVTAGTGLSGGGSSGGVTLTNTGVLSVVAGTGISVTSGQSPTISVNTSQVPLLGAPNVFTTSQVVNGSLSATNLVTTGTVSAGSYQIGGTPFAFGAPYDSNFQTGGNAYIGFAGNTNSTNTGIRNVGIGQSALGANSQGTNGTAVGYQALYSNTTGSANSATGMQALYSNTSGSDDTANGVGALSFNTTGNNNTASGTGALSVNTTGSNNTATGDYALGGNSVGNNNTAVGYVALNTNTGINNTAFGYNTGNPVDGSLLTGASNLFLGFGAAPSTGTLSNAGAIGVLAEVAQNNSIVIGGIAGVNGATVSQSVGIGTTTPSNIFTIGQGHGQAIADGWSTYSSRRWKTNIQTLPDALVKVEQLRGVSYDMKDSGKHEIGVIAEEVGKVVPELVTYEANGTDARGVDYSRLTALLIEAVKQQQKQIATQQSQIEAQQARIRKLQSKVGTQNALLQSRLVKLEAHLDQATSMKARHVGGRQPIVAKAQF